MPIPPKTFVTPEEYLELERKAEHKSEYYNGEIFAMAGASRRHNAIAMQLYGLIGPHLRGKKCRAYPSDMRVLVPGGLYTYPDLSATCEEGRFADSQVDTLLNPSLIIEILSHSTERYDRGTKVKLYRAMPSVNEILLISQDEFDVDLYRRQDDATWTVINAIGLEGSIELTSIGYTLQLRELYENVSE